MGKAYDYQINVQNDKHGHEYHEKQASQSIFENEHGDVNSRRSAKESGDYYASVANLIAVSVAFGVFLRPKKEKGINVYRQKIYRYEYLYKNQHTISMRFIGFYKPKITEKRKIG